MDALALVLVFLGLVALVFTYAATRPRPPSEFELFVMRLSASIEDLQVAIGEALLPAVRKANAEIRRLVTALNDPPTNYKQRAALDEQPTMTHALEVQAPDGEWARYSGFPSFEDARAAAEDFAHARIRKTGPGRRYVWRSDD